MSEILVTPIFLQIGTIVVRVSETDLTRIETLPSEKTYFFILLGLNNNGLDSLIPISESNN